MRILTRYILTEVIAHALLGTALFTFVIFMRDAGHILELVVRNSAPLPSVAELFFLTVPTALTVTIPMGVLVGILIGLSRLAADSEITAMRASGLGALTFLRIVIMFAFAAWVLALANNIYLAPRSAAALSRLQDRLKSSQVSFEVQPRVFYEDFKNYVLYVQDVQAASGAAVWQNIFLADITDPTAPKLTLAKEALVVGGSDRNLRLHLRNGSQHESLVKTPGQYTISSFEETDIPIPAPAAEPKANREETPSGEIPSGQLLDRARSADRNRSGWYGIEFHRRIAYPTACLVLALVGIPLGISSHKGGKSTGFVLTILLVFIYYFISSAGVGLARQGKIAAWAGVWSANIIFALAGFVLLWRADHFKIELFSVKEIWNRLHRRVEQALEEPQLAVIPRKRGFSSRFPQILDDYILRQFIGYLGMVLLSFLVLTLVFQFFDLFNDIIRNRVPLITVAQYLVNVLPSMVYLMTPLSVLLAVLVTFGLMEKSSEITAMKATGISIYRAIVPVLAVAGVVSIGLFLFDESYLPHANKRQDALRNAIKHKPAQTYLRADRRWIFGEQQNRVYYYEFFDSDRNQFAGISIFELDPQTFEITKRIHATRAHWEDDLNKWVFQQGWSRSLRGDAIESYLPFEVATFDELKEGPLYFKKEVRQSSEMDSAELNKYIHDLQQSGFDVARLRVQLHKKFAFPLIASVMAILAVPFSLSAGKKGTLGGVATSIGVAVVYWMISGLFESMGNIHYLPAVVAAWSPDAIFALVGGYLITRVQT